MASDALLTIKEIRGESKDFALPGAIHLQSFTWHLEAPFSGTQRSGAVNVGALVVVKHTDDSSVDLMDYLLRNRVIAKASLVVRKAGEKPLDFYIVNIFDAAVKSIGKSFVEETVVETIAFVFQRFKFEAREQSSRGSAAGHKMIEYSVAENR